MTFLSESDVGFFTGQKNNYADKIVLKNSFQKYMRRGGLEKTWVLRDHSNIYSYNWNLITYKKTIINLDLQSSLCEIVRE